VFEADVKARELRKHGRRLRLQDQPFTMLTMLLQRDGSVVKRAEFCARNCGLPIPLWTLTTA
jgi:DNA-binding winged helix-turn-helix (wHTH) protein